MNLETPPLAVSSWSLHRALGATWLDRPGAPMPATREATYGEGRMALSEMPALLASLGIFRAEICSFHVSSRAPRDLDALRAAFSAAGVTLQTLLVEFGDLTDPATAGRDLAWMEGWLADAARLGAEQVRIIAGKARPSPETLAMSAAGLNRLARHGAELGIRVVTENWFDLLATPADVAGLFARLDGAVGLNGDFGNWSGPDKYEALAAIFPLAVCCHAKGDFSAGALDEADYRACLEAASSAGFAGPYTLIYDGPDDDEVAHIAIERDFIRAHFAA